MCHAFSRRLHYLRIQARMCYAATSGSPPQPVSWIDCLMQGFAGELDLDAALDFKRSPGKPAQRGGRTEPQSSKKRQAKDAKFGELMRFSAFSGSVMCIS